MTLLPNISDNEDKSCPLKNCIRKNYRHIRKWAKRTDTNCFRIYDRHINHYPLAIDYYADRFCIHYFSPSRMDPDPSPELVEEIEEVLCSLFETSSVQIFWRNRVKREKRGQYEKVSEKKDFFTAIEYGVKFHVNLVDYLDTGLFLDHRETRQIVAAASKGKRLLNLFAYTCSFSVHAAVAGAIFTKSVDMSNTYTEWGRRNFILNGIPLKNHEIVRDDCLKFLENEVDSRNRYDVIIIDPPTLSRSKKMDQLFDIQVDYVSLISNGLKLLSDEGTLFFSTNSRRFIFDDYHFHPYKVIEITSKTLPIDFHDPKIHRCWKIIKK